MHAYRALGLDAATGGDEVFRQLVLARIIELTSKLDSARVLEETGISAASYATLKRRSPVVRQGILAGWARGRVRGARRARAGEPGAL